MQKLLVSDLDGTLVGKDKVLTDKVKTAISRWQEAGNIFVIATGRLLSSTEIYADLLSSTEYIICCSGAVTYENKKIISDYTVDFDYVEKLWNIMSETGGYAQIYSDRCLIANRRGGIAANYEKMIESLPDGYSIPIVYKQNFDYTFPKNVHKLSFTFESDEEAEEVLSKLGKLDEFNIFKSLAGLYDIISKNASKGLAVKALAEKLNIIDENVYVAGDNENDVSMFKHFRNSAIIETAPEYLHKKASNVIRSADVSGLADFIDSII